MSVTVEIAWGATYQTASPTWTDITSRVLSIGTAQGRSRKSDDITAGQITLVVDNRDDAFTPDNGSSPYAPDVIPGVPVRITKNPGGGPYYIATCYVEAFRPDLSARPVTCTITAFDLLRTAKAIGVPRYYRTVVLDDSPTWYWPLDRWGGVSKDIALDESGNGRHSSSSSWAQVDGAKIAGVIVGEDGLGLDCTKNGGGVPVQNWSGAWIGAGNVDYSIEMWWDRNGNTVAPGVWYYLFHQLTAGGSDEITLAFQSDRIRYRHNSVYVDHLTDMTTKTDPIQIVCRHLATGAVELYVNGALVGTPTSNTGWVTATNEFVGTNQPGTSPCTVGIIDEVAVWDGAALTPAQITEHWQAGNGGRDERSGGRVATLAAIIGHDIGTDSIDTGAVTMAPRRTVSPLEALADVTQAESGIISTTTDGGLRFRSGLRMPPTPRVSTVWAWGFSHWACDDTSGTSLTDSMFADIWGGFGSPWDAALSGGYTLGQPSLLACYPDGKSVELNGTTGYASVAHDSDWELVLSAFIDDTICAGAWIRPDNVSSTRPIIARSDASAVDWALYINSSAKPVFEIVNTSGTSRTVTGATTLTAGQTYQIAGTWDGTYLKVYVNGGLDGTSANYAAETLRSTSGRGIWIGRRVGSYFDGKMAHVFWGKASTAWIDSPDEWALGLWRVGQPRWTFNLDGSGIPYEQATVEYDDDQIVSAATVTPRNTSGDNAPSVTLEKGGFGERTLLSIEAVADYVAAPAKAATVLDRRGTPRFAVTALDLVPELARTADSYQAAVLAAAPVAYWRFGETSGNFADSSGNSHTLTPAGSPTYVADGALEGDAAVLLDSTGDRASLTNHADFVTPAVTFCGWVKPANAGSLRYLVHRVDGANGFNVRILATNYLNINGPDLSASLSGTTALTAGQWWFFAVTITSGAQKFWLYNPVSDTWIDEATGTATFTPTSTASLTVSSAGQAAPGTCDEWAWFDRVLSESELQTIAAAATNTAWDAIVQMALGDRVLVSHTTPSGAAVNTAGYIHEIAHGKQGRFWRTRIGIAP